jgi:hypothetical protein
MSENELSIHHPLSHSRRKMETIVSNESKEETVVKKEKIEAPPVDDEEAEADF